MLAGRLLHYGQMLFRVEGLSVGLDDVQVELGQRLQRLVVDQLKPVEERVVFSVVLPGGGHGPLHVVKHRQKALDQFGVGELPGLRNVALNPLLVVQVVGGNSLEALHQVVPLCVEVRRLGLGWRLLLIDRRLLGLSSFTGFLFFLPCHGASFFDVVPGPRAAGRSASVPPGSKVFLELLQKAFPLWCHVVCFSLRVFFQGFAMPL